MEGGREGWREEGEKIERAKVVKEGTCTCSDFRFKS